MLTRKPFIGKDSNYTSKPLLSTQHICVSFDGSKVAIVFILKCIGERAPNFDSKQPAGFHGLAKAIALRMRVWQT